MKTGIVTFHNAINYGALLQTYALQTQLEKLECTTQVINYDNPYISSPMKKPNLHEYHNPLNYIRDKKIYGYNMVRSKKLTDFRQHYINLTNKISKEELPLLGELYDLVFTGSDQVWNDKITRNDSTYYLDFVPPYKRSSYAASIGSETIPLERTSHVYNYLKEFKAISVRETSAQKALLGQMGIQAERVLDPTLLLTENDYEKFIINGGTTEKYILVYMLLFSESLLKSAEKLSKKYNLPIKCINASGKIVKIGKDCSEAGIEEWLTLIKRAEYVLTNSFHGVAFSINFNKKFYVELPPTRVNANSRITDILNILDLDNRIIRNQELEESEINYTQVNSIIYSERIKSIQYIKNVLVSKEQNRNKDVSNSIINIEKKYCCGCALCEKVCPADAIKMETDEKGFSYPVMNAEKCINCGKCLKNCGYNQYRYKEHKKMPVNVYAAYSKNEEMVKNSSSGGIFFEIANYVLARNGIVYGAGFTKDFTLEHKDIDSIEDIRPLMGSKYVQSNISTVYEKIARQLKEGKEVLFVGTPCQCVAIKNYCKKYSSNLYIVDFVCHGVPSQRLLKDHIKFVEKKFNKQVKCYIPRTKVAGWGGAIMSYLNFLVGGKTTPTL